MPPEREVAQSGVEAWSWMDRTLISFIGMGVVGAMARVFVSQEPFDVRRFAGELMMAALTGVMLYSFGLLQGLSTPQMMFLGSLGGLGGVRLAEWMIKLIKTARDTT